MKINKKRVITKINLGYSFYKNACATSAVLIVNKTHNMYTNLKTREIQFVQTTQTFFFK